MKLFYKLNITTNNGKIKQFRLFDLPIIQKVKIKNKKYIDFPIFKKQQLTNTEKPIFYLKVNRLEDYAFICLQQWINIVAHMNADYVIVSDKIKLTRNILKKIKFPNENIKIIKSKKNPTLDNIVKYIATKWWVKAAYAHLTTFWHAKENNITSFWNIDADDTLIVANYKDIANTLENIQDYANKRNINAFSMDMWRSRAKKQHWSFGITYTNGIFDWFKVLSENTTTEWQKNYTHLCDEFNLDFYFTYLKDFKNIKIETFYIDNIHFFHWGDFLRNPIGANVCLFKGNKIIFPILLNVYQDKELSIIDIADDCIKFNINNTIDIKQFAYDNIWIIKYYKTHTNKLFCINNKNYQTKSNLVR